MMKINDIIQLVLNTNDKSTRLEKYIKDIDNESFKASDVLALLLDIATPCYVEKTTEKGTVIEDISKIYREKIRSRYSLIVPLIAKFFRCSQEEICLGDYSYYTDTNKNKICPYTVILGNAELIGLDSLGKLRVIGGDAFFCEGASSDPGDIIDCYNGSMGQLEIICGNANISLSEGIWVTNKEITTLGHIKVIGGNLYLDDSPVTDLGDLRVIGGDFSIFGSKIKSLNKLEVIGGDTFLYSIQDYGELKYIGGNAEFDTGDSTGKLGKIEYIGGYAQFMSITDDNTIKSLGNLKSIGGYAYFWDGSTDDLGQLQQVGGNVYLENSKIENLGNLQQVGGTLYGIEKDGRLKSLGKLTKVGGKLIVANDYPIESEFLDDDTDVIIKVSSTNKFEMETFLSMKGREFKARQKNECKKILFP